LLRLAAALALNRNRHDPISHFEGYSISAKRFPEENRRRILEPMVIALPAAARIRRNLLQPPLPRAIKPTVLSALRIVALTLAFGVVASGAGRAQTEGDFGRSERKSGTLIGIFYDLKQTQQRQPIADYARHYTRSIDEFLVAGFDEVLFNRFFRAARPLYTTQLNMRRMNADAAPKAFGVDDVVEPSYWIVHYKGQVAPPANGTYRFVGNFDDVLIVAVNGKVVLDGSLVGTRFPKLGWTEPSDKGPSVAVNKGSRYGNWLDLKAGQPVDLDILIGERPGGVFYGVLLYEKKGETYPLDGNGHALLPLFQVAEQPVKDPLILTSSRVWTCFD
jgi:hypothetical protein